MIVFKYNYSGVISVIRRGEDPARYIGRFHFVSYNYEEGKSCWLWDAGRASLDIYRTLSHSEKLDIIGMLDAMNQAPIRPITDMKRRWEEIIGLEAVEYLRTDNEAKPITLSDAIDNMGL